MADRVAITSLGSLVTPATGDELIITDVSDTTDGANGTTKKITRDNLIGSTLVGLEGVTASAAELNILDGVTATASELNVLDGITATVSELNITDGGNTTEKVLNTQCKVYAYLSADQDNIPNDSFVRVEFDAEAFDVGGDMSGARFTAPVTGYYVVSGNVEFEAGTVADGKTIGVLIYVNGSQYQKCRSLVTIGATNSSSASITSIVYMTASQYLDLYCYHNHGDGSPDVESTGTFLSIHLLSV